MKYMCEKGCVVHSLIYPAVANDTTTTVLFRKGKEYTGVLIDKPVVLLKVGNRAAIVSKETVDKHFTKIK